MRSIDWIPACVLAVTSACTADLPPPWTHTSRTEQPVVYGEDDRSEVYDHPDATLRQLAVESVAVLIDADLVMVRGDGTVELDMTPLRDEANYCETERFLDQPSPAHCSAVLVDHDLMLTAGHCVNTLSACNTTAFVFDYYYGPDGQLGPVDASDVYRCVRAERRATAGLDFAIVQLDRTAEARSAVDVGGQPLQLGDPVTMIGSPLGVPLKITGGGFVLRLLDEYSAEVSLDAFRGNSGSPVFDGEGNLGGLLASGQADFSAGPGGCRQTRVLPQGGQPGEDSEVVTTIEAVLESFCHVEGWDAPTFCNSFPDRVCSEACTPLERRCAGDQPQVCDIDPSGCPDWTDSAACAPLEQCASGWCTPVCDVTCEHDEVRCTEDGMVQICMATDRICNWWSPPTACPDDQACIDGQCQGECDDECHAGELRCADDTRSQVCERPVEDQCWRWSEPSSCGVGWDCLNGGCVPRCDSGARRCSGDRSALFECMHADTGPAWVASQCPEGTFCTENRCVVQTPNSPSWVAPGEIQIPEPTGRSLGRGQACDCSTTLSGQGALWPWLIGLIMLVRRRPHRTRPEPDHIRRSL